MKNTIETVFAIAVILLAVFAVAFLFAFLIKFAQYVLSGDLACDIHEWKRQKRDRDAVKRLRKAIHTAQRKGSGRYFGFAGRLSFKVQKGILYAYTETGQEIRLGGKYRKEKSKLEQLMRDLNCEKRYTRYA